MPNPRNHLPVLGAALLASATLARADVYVIDFAETPAAGLLSLAEIPRAPTYFVVDEAGLLPGELRGRVEKALTQPSASPTYLVIEKGPLSVAPEVYANELLRRWVTTGRRLAALVLAVEEPLPATHVILAGRGLDATDREHLRDLGRAALQLVSDTTGVAEGAAATAIGLDPALGAFAEAYAESPLVSGETEANAATDPTPEAAAAVASRRSPTKKATTRWQMLSEKLNWVLIRRISAIGGGLILIASTLLLLPRILRHRRLLFPEHEPRRRFGAPYAGGSNAQIRYGG